MGSKRGNSRAKNAKKADFCLFILLFAKNPLIRGPN
jgi:hypothetical protein